MATHWCYTLCNSSNSRTYVGYTIQPARRIRQHNGEVSGGARATHRHRAQGGAPWQFMFLVTAEHAAWDHHTALSLEWHLKRATRRVARSWGPLARWAALAHVLSYPRFAAFSRSWVILAADTWLDAGWERLLCAPLPELCLLPLDAMSESEPS